MLASFSIFSTIFQKLLKAGSSGTVCRPLHEKAVIFQYFGGIHNQTGQF